MKKFLSVILALTMVIALVPAVFAADSDALVYNFKWDAYTAATGNVSPRTRNGTAYEATYTFSDIDSTVSAQWRIDGIQGIANGGGTIGSNGIVHNILAANSPNAYSIALNVTRGGTFEANVSFKRKANGYTADVWLVRKADNAGLTDKTLISTTDLTTLVNGIDTNKDAQKLGTINMDTDANENEQTITTWELENATVTPGEYRLIFNVTQKDAVSNSNGEIINFTLTPLTEDTALTNAFIKDENKEDVTNSYTAPTVTGLTSDTTITAKNGTISGTFTLTAPATKADKGNFLYWAKGMTNDKKIVSFSNVLENYMPEENGRNYLVAVYAGDLASSADKEYFNQNGQRVATRTAEDTTIPDLPSMAGYGVAKEWKQHGKTNIYVADYEKTKDDRDEITVDVVNGTGGGTVLFGDPVTCTADETKGTFKCWTKSKIHGATDAEPEIVSVDPTYKFKAWEDCTVTAVYEVHNYTGNTMKIIIDTFTVGSDTGVMAEFIGLDSAVEKGIMFTDSDSNTTKIAMTTKDNQFTVIADEPGTYEGYAIVENTENNGYTLITDGEYTK